MYILKNPAIIPNSKKIKKNIGLVKKILSIPSPMHTPTIMGEIKSGDLDDILQTAWTRTGATRKAANA